MVTNPNSLLSDDIAAQTITETTVLAISTAAGTAPNAFGGAEDIPFLGPNADVAEVSAIFWIEKIRGSPPCSP